MARRKLVFHQDRKLESKSGIRWFFADSYSGGLQKVLLQLPKPEFAGASNARATLREEVTMFNSRIAWPTAMTGHLRQMRLSRQTRQTIANAAPLGIQFATLSGQLRSIERSACSADRLHRIRIAAGSRIVTRIRKL